MKIHSDILTHSDLVSCLKHRKIPKDIEIIIFKAGGSRSRKNRYEVQLGTDDKRSGPTKTRHHKSNNSDPAIFDLYAASYDEWGWYLSNIFKLDPKAKAGPYDGRDRFNEMTNNQFEDWRS